MVRNVTVTVNGNDHEVELDFDKVGSLDELVKGLKLIYPDATSFVVVFLNDYKGD